MASMSQNSSSQSLMGFSVYQPEIGAALQFFPEMGSQALDEMIDAYVPGAASILDKRTAVSLEFFDYAMQTGESFKLFLLPATASNTASPASTMQDSGYASSFNTSPVMSDSIWRQTTDNWPFNTSSSKKPRTSAKKAASSRAQVHDFSHIPGMKIMTKDGLDVTNSASRGCKTKEQRDHAHLMRIIKACDSCKRKKTRCDPSHKKRGSSAAASPEPRISKKAKKASAPSPSVQKPPSMSSDYIFNPIEEAFDPSMPESLPFDANFMAAPDASIEDWDQFITYEDELNNGVPQDYDFFMDPAGYFSPVTPSSSSASPSQSQNFSPGYRQPVTPANRVEIGSGVVSVGSDVLGANNSHQPAFPYLSESVELGNNYIDFALYSPGSTCLDEDDPRLSSEVAAPLDFDTAHYKQVSSSHKPDVRSSLRGGTSTSPQDRTVSHLDGSLGGRADDNASAQGSKNRGTLEGIVRSDQEFVDRGHDRDQQSGAARNRVSDLTAHVGAPPGATKWRVPSMNVSPSDLLLEGRSSQYGVRSQSPGLGGVDASTVLAEGIKRRRAVQSMTTTSAQSDGLVPTARPHSLPEKISVSAIATVGTIVTTARVPAVSPPSNEVLESRDVVQRRYPGVLRHQRRPEELRGQTEGLVVHAHRSHAIENLASTADVLVGTYALVSESSAQYGTVSGNAVYETQTMPHATGSLQATSTPIVGGHARILPGLLPVNGLIAASVVLGALRANAVRSVAPVGVSSLFALFSCIVVVAILLSHGLSSTAKTTTALSLHAAIGLHLVSAVLIALPLFATVSAKRQSNTTCLNKLSAFAQALPLAGQMSNQAIDNVKLKISCVQSSLMSLRRTTGLMSRSASRYPVKNGMNPRITMVC